MQKKKTLVFGASLNPNRYAHRAVKKLLDEGVSVVAIGGRAGTIRETEVLTGHPPLEDIDTITLYMGAQRLQDHEEYLLSLAPRRIIFNPGAENRHFAYKARAVGIETIEACTLVMLTTGEYTEHQ
jgi:predicted CoA-binding protein